MADHLTNFEKRLKAVKKIGGFIKIAEKSLMELGNKYTHRFERMSPLCGHNSNDVCKHEINTSKTVIHWDDYVDCMEDNCPLIRDLSKETFIE